MKKEASYRRRCKAFKFNTRLKRQRILKKKIQVDPNYMRRKTASSLKEEDSRTINDQMRLKIASSLKKRHQA